MPPEAYRQARDTAQFHVQLKIETVEAPARFPGACTVSGGIVRVFRGPLALGTTLRLAVSCKRAQDRDVPKGGEMWTDWQALRGAEYLEAYVNAVSGGYEIALWQSAIVPAPSDTPRFTGHPGW